MLDIEHWTFTPLLDDYEYTFMIKGSRVYFSIKRDGKLVWWESRNRDPNANDWVDFELPYEVKLRD